MAVATVAAIVEALNKLPLLEPKQTAQLAALQKQYTDPKTFTQELVQRQWLTAFQAKQLVLGKGPGLTLDQYVVLDLLGEGGMGAVFKARQTRMGRLVALKIIRREALKSSGSLERFQREARVAAKLSHANVVSIFDSGADHGTNFMVMEYIEGTDLAKLVEKSGPLPVAQACDYIRQAACGLQHAHDMGLVHRDIKPHNLMLTKLGLVKVMDLGLARTVHSADAATSPTATGAVMGTPNYMAPEQSLDAKTVDGRADIYSLGCTLYHLLAGEAPFAGMNVAGVLVAHQMTEPKPLTEYRTDLPPALLEVVRRMMAKKREERTPAAASVAQDLAPFVAATNLVTAAIPSRPTGNPFVGIGPQTARRKSAGETNVESATLLPLGRRRSRLVAWTVRAFLIAIVVGCLGLVTAGMLVYLAQSSGTNQQTSAPTEFNTDAPAGPDIAQPTATHSQSIEKKADPVETKGDPVETKEVPPVEPKVEQPGEPKPPDPFETLAKTPRPNGTTDAARNTAVAAGLAWLSVHQADDGHWGLNHFQEHGKCNCGGVGGNHDVAASAFGLLPFLRAGQTHRGDGPNRLYAKTIERSLKWFITRQGVDGSFSGNGYEHAIATLCICEAYARTADPQLKGPAQRAINCCVAWQAADGGFRYSPRSPGDMSNSGWFIQALTAGSLAGLNVPAETFNGINNFLDMCANADGSGYTYQKNTANQAAPVVTAAGLMARQSMGWGQRNLALNKGLAYLQKLPPSPNFRSMFYYYYATHVVHRMASTNPEAWEQWNTQVRRLLLDKQDWGDEPFRKHQKGSWTPDGDHWGAQLGRVGITSFALMTLLVPERLASVPKPADPQTKPPEPPPYTGPKYDQLLGKSYVENSIGMVFVKIPAGSFTMGSPKTEKDRNAEETQHAVEITQPFNLGIFTVTQEQYEKVMKTNPSFFAATGDGKAKVQGMDTRHFPVENVSWTDADKFCSELSNLAAEKEAGRVYRLPTEAEWEYACRGGASSHSVFHFGNTLTSDLANFNGRFPYPDGTAKGTYLQRTVAVGSYKPNSFGLYDMHGNVWQWCADWFASYNPTMRQNPIGPDTGTTRVLHGGSWFSNGKFCRTASRDGRSPGARFHSVGFRVVLAANVPMPRPPDPEPKKDPESKKDPPLKAILPMPVDRLQKDIDKAQVTFNETCKRLDKSLLDAISKDMALVRVLQISAQERQNIIDVLTAEESAFKSNGTIPWSLRMRPNASAYLASRQAAELPLRLAYKNASEHYRTERDDATVSKIGVEEKTILAPKVVAVWDFTGKDNKRWNRTLYSNGKLDNPYGIMFWTFDNNKLVLHLAPNNPKGVIDTCTVDAAGQNLSGRNQGGYTFTAKLRQ